MSKPETFIIALNVLLFCPIQLSDCVSMVSRGNMTKISTSPFCCQFLTFLLKHQNNTKWIYCKGWVLIVNGKMTLSVSMVQGGRNHFNQWSLLKITWLLSTWFWYCIVQKENMERPPSPPWNTHGGEVKQSVETLPWRKSYRYSLTTYITTELMSNSVQYAHLGKYKNWKGVIAQDRCKFDIYCKNFELAELRYK